MRDPGTKPEPLDELQARLFSMLNTYAGNPRCSLAGKIVRQMEHILTHPLIDLFPELQFQYAKCINGWRARASFGVEQVQFATITASSIRRRH